ncbi:Dehydrogenase/reductase SDR family member 11, partial [Caligus rogercresseyi]
GMKVIGCGRREERITELNKEHGVNIIPYKCDVSQIKEVTKMFDWIKSSKDSFGALSLLVCNAGFSTKETLMEGDPDSWIKMMDVNVIAASLATQLAIKQFLEFAWTMDK